MLKKSKADYKKDLKDSGFQSSKLEYIKTAEKKTTKNRRENIIWFNPPFKKIDSPNVAKRFY